MRRRLLVIVVVVMAALAWTALAQHEGQSQDQSARGGFGAMSAEQRQQMRQRWETMSEEERAQFREQMRQRFENMSEEERAQMRGRFAGRRMTREDQLKSLAAIEEQVAKLKAALNTTTEGDRPNFREMSEEQRTQWRERMTKQREARTTALTAIETELDKLRGPRPQEANRVQQLTRIQALAKEENATRTAQALQTLIARETAARQAGDTGAAGPEAMRRRGTGTRDRGAAREGAAEGGSER